MERVFWSVVCFVLDAARILGILLLVLMALGLMLGGSYE